MHGKGAKGSEETQGYSIRGLVISKRRKPWVKNAKFIGRIRGIGRVRSLRGAVSYI